MKKQWLTLFLVFFGCWALKAFQQGPYVMTVNGRMPVAALGKTLVHEHIITNFNGTDQAVEALSNPQQAIDSVLPWLRKLRMKGYSTLVECTPSYLGKNADLLHRLSELSGLAIITNTGYYAAVDKKYLPGKVDTLDAETLADIWEEEWIGGIGGSNIRPGFIKLGVGSGALDSAEEKIVTAGFLLSNRTGLPVYVHTGGDQSIISQYRLAERIDFDLNRLVWVHAQNGSDSTRIAMAEKGVWVSLDGVNENQLEEYIGMIGTLRDSGNLKRLLISHDDGWSVDDTGTDLNLALFNNGNSDPYTTIETLLIPRLREIGYSDLEINLLLVQNPSKALGLQEVREK
jgi:phosphotriesterase-related protein